MPKTLPAPDYTAPQGREWPCPQQQAWEKKFTAGKDKAQKGGAK